MSNGVGITSGLLSELVANYKGEPAVLQQIVQRLQNSTMNIRYEGFWKDAFVEFRAYLMISGYGRDGRPIVWLNHHGYTRVGSATPEQRRDPVSFYDTALFQRFNVTIPVSRS